MVGSRVIFSRVIFSRVIFFMLLHLFICIPILSQDDEGDYIDEGDYTNESDYVNDTSEEDAFFYIQGNPGQKVIAPSVVPPVIQPVVPTVTAPVIPEAPTITSSILTPPIVPSATPAVLSGGSLVAPVTPSVTPPVVVPPVAQPIVPVVTAPVVPVTPVVTPVTSVSVPTISATPVVPPVATPVVLPVAPPIVPAVTAITVPAVPPAVPVVVPAIEEDIHELEGINTIDINEPEGNWLFKRIWWEYSKDLFGKIRDHVDKIVESRMHFFEQRVKLDRNLLDPFYVNVGLEQGELAEIVSHLFELMKTEWSNVESLSGRELERYNLLIQEKSNLEKLRVSVADIQILSGGLDEALKNLMEQINRTRSYEREAWGLLNEIAEELSDKKAREHYYEIATIWRNVKDIGNYIVGPFSMHFVELGDALIKRIQEVQTAMVTLKEKGVEFSKEIEAEHEDECKIDHDEDEDDEEPVVKVGWLTWVWQKLTAPFRWIGRSITGLFGW